MKRQQIISLAIIFLVVVIFFRAFFLMGKVPIPTDTLVNLFHPLRDFYANNYPRGVPYKNPLIGDPVIQQIPWRELALSLMTKLQLPLWNPYQMAGYPLLGNIQSAPFYPLNIILVVLPFIYGWSFFIFLQQILAATFMYFYLRNLKLATPAYLVGAMSFAFCGFVVSWLEWGTIVHTALWLPLLLLAIDKFRDTKEYRWLLIFIFAFISSFLAGHLQTFLYSAGIVILYMFFRFYSHRERRILFLLGGAILISILLTLPVWWSQLQLISLSARNVDQSWQQPGWFIPPIQAIQFLTPDFFGNPATGNYFGVWNYGEFIGYIGIFPLLLAIVSLISRKRKDSYFWLCLIVLAAILAFQNPIAIIPYAANIPFFSSTQPTRLIFVIDVGLSILAAFGLDEILTRKTKIIWPQVILLGLFAGIIGYGMVASSRGIIAPANWHVALHNLIVPYVLIVSVSLGVFVSSLFKGKKKSIVVYCLLGITIGDLLFFAGKYTSFASKTYFFPDTKAISFLQKQPGTFRVMTTDREILHPNLATMYHLQSIDGYDPLYLLSYGQMIASIGRSKPDITPPFGFFRIVTTGNYDSPLINLMGVRYVLSLNDIQSKHLTKIFTEGETKVYENKSAFPRTFFVPTIHQVASQQQAIDFMFNPQNDLRLAAVVTGEGSHVEKNWVVGQAHITNYSPNTVTITTSNDGDGFLILTDTFYPTWHATVDGREVPIYRTDFNFRGIVVPKGQHHVVFNIKLFS
ncbi:MAG TPA: YfhO family protein [Patescibacteria group bacterium]|nr:YfhO family protein [Patescibacteria group bacterium]